MERADEKNSQDLLEEMFSCNYKQSDATDLNLQIHNSVLLVAKG